MIFDFDNYRKELMKGNELREVFLDYFKSKGHEIVKSSSLVPHEDPTLLFSNAGMNQFKNAFLGLEKRANNRAASAQKCLRISGKHNDFENVGASPRHQTFFEMLGNFSFGDYFKKEAIQYAWEFVTEVLKLPKNRLWVTVFEEDDEAARLWGSLTDVAKDRILRCGAEDNFWAMGDTGPCGPCSEIFYFLGPDTSVQSEDDFRKDDGRYVEIWNLVFMQFNRDAQGALNPLPSPSVDTGMGMERVAAILQGQSSNYHSDLLRPLIGELEMLSGFKYDGSSFEKRDLLGDQAYARDVAMRAIADHARSVAFLIGDGVFPESDGRGYVLRRLIRRAVRHGRTLNFNEPFLFKIVELVNKLFGDDYQELKERGELILKVVQAEERKFGETVEGGLAVLKKEVVKLKKGQLFSGQLAFLLHDTYGFPLDLTQDALKAYGISVDTVGFERCMQEQKKRSREDRKSQNVSFPALNIDCAASEFVGYDSLESEAVILAIVAGNDKSSFLVVTDRTPFYAESGGQVGDTGLITTKDARLLVSDTRKTPQGHFLHECSVVKGAFSEQCLGEKAQLKVDPERRSNVRAHHSATHLLHSALRQTLGDHVKQAGSKVAPDALRFDYTHFEPLEPGQLRAIEYFVNKQIRANHEVVTSVMSLEEAKAKGATALFGEKYGDSVRVVQIGPESMELCGGTHVTKSGEIGTFVVSSEAGISAGVRRIECLAGEFAEEKISAERDSLKKAAEILKSDPIEVPGRIERLQEKLRSLERELESKSSQMAASASGDLIESARITSTGIKVIAQKIDGLGAEALKQMVDSLRVKLGSGVVVLGGTQGDKAVLVAGVTSDLTERVNAGSIVKEVSRLSGGKGGGRADFAQAGGVDPARLNLALEKIFELVS